MALKRSWETLRTEFPSPPRLEEDWDEVHKSSRTPPTATTP